MKNSLDISPPVAVLLAVLLGLCGFFSFGVTRRLVDATMSAKREAAAQQDPYYLQTYLRRYSGSLTLLGNDVSFARLLITDEDAPEYGEVLADANKELEVRLKAYPYLSEISIVNREGVVVASSEQSYVGTRAGRPSGGAQATVSAGSFDIRAFVDKDKSFTVMIPVKVADRLVGAVVGKINLEHGGGAA